MSKPIVVANSQTGTTALVHFKAADSAPWFVQWTAGYEPSSYETNEDRAFSSLTDALAYIADILVRLEF